MKVSVIVAVYNRADFLALVLAGLRRQTRPPDEVVLADDGSGPEFAAAIPALTRDLPFPVRHVWQEDRGIRKARILNLATARAAGDYLIFLDGDCVAVPSYVAIHCARARPGVFLSARRVMLDAGASAALTPEIIARADFPDQAFLRAHSRDWRSVENRHYLSLGPVTGRLLQAAAKSRGMAWIGSVSSTWAAHLWEVNGHDHRFTSYGGDDIDLGNRLMRAGIRSHSIRYLTTVLHLDHGRSYFDPEKWADTEALMEASRKRSPIICKDGLRQAK